MYRKAGLVTSTGITQMNIGNVYANQGDYQKALASYEQSLQTIRSSLLKNQAAEAAVFHNIGRVNSELGLVRKALDFYQKASSTYQKLGYQASTGKALSIIGRAYVDLKQYSKAQAFYQRGLVIARSLGDFNAESDALYGLGQLYTQQAQPQQALAVLQKALSIQQKIGIRPKEAVTLSKLGQVQTQLDQFTEAQSKLQRSLTLAQEIGDRPTEALALANFGTLFAKQNQSELAIAFYKQSVSTYENIRNSNRKLPREQQESYTETIAKTYRDLADLLLQQDRILEARQVIELLKLQELEDYSKDTRGKLAPLTFLKAETELLKTFNTRQQGLIQIAQELAALRSKPGSEKTPDDKKRIRELDELQIQADAEMSEFLNSPQTKALIQQLRETDKTIALTGDDIEKLKGNLKTLQKSQQQAAIIYPFVLDNRLEILIITANAPPLRRTVPEVDRSKLNHAIAALGNALTTPSTDPKPSAQTLYRMLIAPIEADLKQAKINTLIYSPDRRLRSIPLGALHDGEQWLAERFQITYITASTTSDLTTPREGQPKILAGTISEDVKKTYQVTVLNTQYPFQGLPAGKSEIKGIQSTIPSTTILVEQDFTNDQIRDHAGQYNILHFATHGYFKLNQPDQSFILLGAPDSKGKNYATLRDIHLTWKLSGIDLVTLSACETGVVAEKSDDKLGIMGLEPIRKVTRSLLASYGALKPTAA